MSRLALFILSCVLYASVSFTFASPVNELVNVEKRDTRTGRGTWYYPGMGNCGRMDTSADLILAISKELYDSNGGGNCAQWVYVEFNGIVAYGLTVDSCKSCGPNDIDMSPALFQKLAPLTTGDITVSWHFMSESWAP